MKLNIRSVLSSSLVPRTFLNLLLVLNLCLKRSRYSLTLLTFLGLLLLMPPEVLGQGAGSMGFGNNMGGSGNMNGSTARGSDGFTLGYPAVNQANIDKSIFSGNEEMLRNDIDFEDYLLRKRTAFVQQMQVNDQNEEKLRAYAEQRLKKLTQSKGKLPVSQQAEARDLMSWLKKDAEQRANNLTWLKREDQAVASLEQDQLISVQNQRNSLHNMFEDNIALQGQYKWNQQMQLASLHQTQENNGVLFGSHQPFVNNIGSYGGGYGRGYGNGYSGYGNRWSY